MELTGYVHMYQNLIYLATTFCPAKTRRVPEIQHNNFCCNICLSKLSPKIASDRG